MILEYGIENDMWLKQRKHISLKWMGVNNESY